MVKIEHFRQIGENRDFRPKLAHPRHQNSQKRAIFCENRPFLGILAALVCQLTSLRELRFAQPLANCKTGTLATPKMAASSLRSQTAHFWGRGCASFSENLRFSSGGGFHPPSDPPNAQKTRAGTGILRGFFLSTLFCHGIFFENPYAK